MWLEIRNNLINLQQVARILYSPGTSSVWAIFPTNEDVLIYRGPQAAMLFDRLAALLGHPGLVSLADLGIQEEGGE